MPLLPPSSQTAGDLIATLPPNKTHFLIFFASPEERGRPWCRDCENAEAPISANIKESESTLVFVGSRDEWNKDDNTWRQPPFNVERVPTILKISPTSEGQVQSTIASAPRLVEAEILEHSILRKFIQG